MAISYKLMKNYNPSSTYYNKYYAKAVHTETTNLETLAERIQRNCTAKKSDVMAVLTELVEVLKDELQASHIVRIDGFGTFRVGIQSKYADTEEAFNAAQCVTGYKVNFRPEYTMEKTGQYVDEEGVSHVRRAAVAELTRGLSVRKY